MRACGFVPEGEAVGVCKGSQLIDKWRSFDSTFCFSLNYFIQRNWSRGRAATAPMNDVNWENAKGNVLKVVVCRSSAKMYRFRLVFSVLYVRIYWRTAPSNGSVNNSSSHCTNYKHTCSCRRAFGTKTLEFSPFAVRSEVGWVLGGGRAATRYYVRSDTLTNGNRIMKCVHKHRAYYTFISRGSAPCTAKVS